MTIFRRFLDRVIPLGTPVADVGLPDDDLDLGRVPEESYFLCRIVGNDLAPRHRPGQSFNNLKFILTHEVEFAHCVKFWLVNRIWSADEANRIVALLEAHGQLYHQIPFDLATYGAIEFDAVAGAERGLDGKLHSTLPGDRQQIIEAAARRSKNIYAINNNGARNIAIEIGRRRARWIMPWDGNSFLTPESWRQIRSGIHQLRRHHYITVPMARIDANSQLLDEKFVPDASDEPQIAFRADAPQRFDERFPYGRRPKVELLWRLGVRGSWDRLKFDPSDLPRPAPIAAGSSSPVGWVARLSSGNSEMETGPQNGRLRNAARSEAIVMALDQLDVLSLASRLNPGRLTFYDDAKLCALGADPQSATRTVLHRKAEEALLQPARSVADKPTAPIGGKLNDYWSVAPYWWPNPDTPDGLPFVRRDGERVPGTKLLERGSERYDRSRLYAMINDVTTLALAWRVFDQPRYAQCAALHIKTWFLDPDKQMTPHLEFAQVRGGRLDGRGAVSGIVEAKDFYFFMDALRLLEDSKALTSHEWAELRGWFRKYFDWLTTSGRGRHAVLRTNNLGTMYDLQSGAIAAYLGEVDELRRVLLRARTRIGIQIGPNGDQRQELDRVARWHYSAFNLAGWTALARLASSVDDGLWHFTLPDGRGLELAIEWLLSNAPIGSDDRFCSGNLGPLAADARLHFGWQGRPDGASYEQASLDSGYAPFAELSRD